MKRSVFSHQTTVLFFTALILFCSCSNEKKPKDISESVQSTTSIIDKNIQVQINEGVVILEGEVPDEATRTAAVNAVRHIEGVKSVQSHLTVKTPDPVPVAGNRDIQLKSAIDSSLRLKGITGVDIKVIDGEVTLSGEVPREQQVAVLKAAAKEHPAKVTSFLTVTDK